MSNHQLYYAEGGEQRGPVSVEHFRSLNLPGNTLVWYQGLSEWIAASEAPLTRDIYQGETMMPSAPSMPGGGEPSYAPGVNHPPVNMGPCPSSNLVWGILTTLFCCLPLGIVSIVYAAKVSGLYSAGMYDAAVDASRKAGKWAMWSAIASVIWWVLYLLFFGSLISSLYYF